MKKMKVDRTASKGIAIGKAFIPQKASMQPNTYRIVSKEAEIGRFKQSVEQAVRQLEIISEGNPILSAAIETAKDPSLHDGVISKIMEEQKNAEESLWEISDTFISIFVNSGDEYMCERAADVKDIRDRIMGILKGIKEDPFEDIKQPVIIVAEDLSPSDTASLNLDYVLGFITRDGGITSHVSIIANNIGLPALVGVSDIMKHVNDGDIIIMDAEEGEIVIDPDETTVKEYMRKKDKLSAEKERLISVSSLPVVTKDGKAISVYANVGDLSEIKAAKKLHIHGVGLFRSEFLYMGKSRFPTEDEQFYFYKEAAENMEEELTVRTLDVGGDKELSYLTFEKEENPFLGWRGIRISLEKKDIFEIQIRALLRASAYGPIRILLPMIISVEELKAAKAIIDECKEELREKGIEYNANTPVGVMIETPASVLCADALAEEADFFSIGTNDLTQYMLAVDRGNKKVAESYNSFHPAVLKSIKFVIEAAHKAGIKVGMCGEFAGDKKAVKLLLGFGLDEFSMAAMSAPAIKEQIRALSYSESKAFAHSVITCKTLKEIEGMITTDLESALMNLSVH